MLNGVGMGDAAMKKIRLLRRLTNTGFNLQCQAANSLKECLASERAREEAERLEFERQQREKDRICKRIANKSFREMGQAIRQLKVYAQYALEKERVLMLKQRALMLNGVGMGDAAMKKVQLIKRLT